MKRGRPNSRLETQKSIIKTLESSSTPLTVSALAKIISGERGKKISWNTVQKYLEELVKLDKVQPIALPHSKIEGKNGIIVYQLKK